MSLGAVFGIHIEGDTFAKRSLQLLATSSFELSPAYDSEKSVALANRIVLMKPSAVIVCGAGGWCNRLVSFLGDLQSVRNFPVIWLTHSPETHFAAHSKLHFAREIGLVDVVAFSDYKEALYYRGLREDPVTWLPHFVPLGVRVPTPKESFRVSLISQSGKYFGEEEPVVCVLRDFESRFPGVELKQPLAESAESHFGLRSDSGASLPRHLLVKTVPAPNVPIVMQEAWARGIPVIHDSSCNSLTTNPLLHLQQQIMLKELCMSDPSDRLELYYTLARAKRNWAVHSTVVFAAVEALSARGAVYRERLLSAAIRGYRAGKMDDPVFGLFLTDAERLRRECSAGLLA
jgi:hypothetical protein